MVKESSGGDEKAFSILKSRDIRFDNLQLPPRIQPGGMSDARRKYLFTSVRPYVRPEYQDVTCPRDAQ